jgi:hypothetical protein
MDTGRGYNLGGAGLSNHTPRPLQPMVLRFSPKGPTDLQFTRFYQQFQVKVRGPMAVT